MKLWKKAISSILCLSMLVTGTAFSASADDTADEWGTGGYIGDLNRDNKLSVADIIILQKYLLGKGKLGSEVIVYHADINEDNQVNVIDLALLKQRVLNQEYWYWGTEPEQEETEPPQTEGFLGAPIYPFYNSLPSQGIAKVAIFYVDFPDCKYDYEPSLEDLSYYAFGDAVNDTPFETMHSFYANSSKGAMNLQGQVFRYTTKENKSAYENYTDWYGTQFKDKEKIIKECLDAFNETTDFSQFDGDGDKKIDAIIISVPTKAGDEYWWPEAGPDNVGSVDGVSVADVVTGNAEITADSHTAFVDSYLHEMGHCMGLPDYYLYHSEDYEGFHGNAGTELMDSDAHSDFGCFSKLMLGWYKNEQVQVFDPNQGAEQTFILHNAQTNDGNCLILPYGEWSGNYYSEYMILEYITPDGNNSDINNNPNFNFFCEVGNGIRVYHVKADVEPQTGMERSFVYDGVGEYHSNSQSDDGIRVVRLANDAEGGSVLKTGDTINGDISGFHWYDENGNESIETGYEIKVGDLVDGQYTITVTKK